jgi:diadenosine tetraphosphate (Ap4A) HIT family hydrolase
MMNADFQIHPQLAQDSILLADWPLSQLRLSLDANYPWFILVPRRNNIKEIIDLSTEEQLQLWQESAFLSRWLQQYYQGDKLNIAALGNMVPQLHVHHIVRFKSDPAWPAPVWGKVAAIGYTEAELTKLLQAVPAFG